MDRRLRVSAFFLVITLSICVWAQAKPATRKTKPSQTSRSTSSSLVPSTGKYEIARYLNIQSASSPTFSPRGHEIAYLSNLTGTNQVWKKKMGGEPQQLTFYEDRVQRVKWSPRGDVILFTKDQGGNERSQLYLMDPDGENVRALTHAPKVIHQFGNFSQDGLWICYSSNERDERFFDPYVMNLATGEARRLLEAEQNTYADSFSPDAKYVLAAREHTNSDDNLYLIEVATGKATLLTPHAGEAIYDNMEWAPDGSGFYLSSNQDRDQSALAFYDVKTKAMKWVEEAGWELDDNTGISIDRGGDQLFYAWNENGASHAWVRDLKTGKKMALKPGGVIGRGSFSGDGSKLAFASTSSARNSDVQLWDLAANRISQFTRSSRAGIPRDSFMQPQLIAYTSFDGMKIPAWFYLPKNAKKDGTLPVIINVHGGPEGQARDTFSAVNQYLLNRGYALLVPNIRGSSGYGKQYIHADDYKKRPDAIKDVAMGVEFLKSTGYVDPRKIVIMGGSYGGFMTLAQATMNPDLWAAAVESWASPIGRHSSRTPALTGARTAPPSTATPIKIRSSWLRSRPSITWTRSRFPYSSSRAPTIPASPRTRRIRSWKKCAEKVCRWSTSPFPTKGTAWPSA